MKDKDFKSFLKYLNSFGLLDRSKVPQEYYRAWKIVVLGTKEYGTGRTTKMFLDSAFRTFKEEKTDER
jgi:hypothetical protein